MCNVPAYSNSWALGHQFRNFAPHCEMPTLTLNGKDTIAIIADNGGNTVSKTRIVKVIKSDTLPPKISIIGDSKINIYQYQRTLTKEIIASSDLDSSKVGLYSIAYKVSDNSEIPALQDQFEHGNGQKKSLDIGTCRTFRYG